MKKRKVPMRLCLGCGSKKDKRELIRVVKTPEGEVFLDETGKKPGRGAYICPHLHCLEAALKTKKLEKSLRQSIDHNVIEKMRDTLNQGHTK